MKGKRIVSLASTGFAALLVSPLFAPQLLAFPYTAEIGRHRVYSEQPIDAHLVRVVQRADAAAANSPLATPSSQPLFFTTAGWRWTWLTQSGASGPFGISRAGVETIVLNRSEPNHDRIHRAAEIGGARSLSAVLAHEMTHGAIRARFGILADVRYPRWLREGFCDYVAGGSTLTNAAAESLLKTDPSHPALEYWRGRKRVASELEQLHGDVEALFRKYS